MDFYYLIGGLISLIALICFFKIGHNLAVIRKKITDLQPDTPPIRELKKYSYYTNRAVGKNAAAAEDLTFILMYDLLSEEMSDTERAVKYDEFREKNKPKYDALGQPFPDYPF